jgi:hypothetical protein
MQTYWSTVGDWEQAKSWDGTNGPANEWAYVKFLEGLGKEAFGGDGRMRRPEEFSDPATKQRALQAWQDRGGGRVGDFGEQAGSFVKTRFSELPDKFEDALSFGPLKRKLRGEDDAFGTRRNPGTALRDSLFKTLF